MHFDIRTQGFDLTAGLREHAERRLTFALDRARHDIGKVNMRLSDINGPRGGRDKRCLVRIAIPRAREVVVEDTDTDLYVAIDRAVDRIERSVSRRLERLRQYPHIQLNVAAAGESDAASDAVAALGTD